VQLGKEVAAALSAHRHLRGPFVFCDADGNRLTNGECKWPLYTACTGARLRRIGWHVLRHTFGSQLAMQGVAPGAIQKLMGNALASFFDDPERAGAVGAAYRRATPTESTIDALLARVLDAGVAEARALAATDPGALYERLRAQHESDFAFDRVANVGGWMLSLTEARVCAVVSIAEG
jgi:hypothetical protein